MAANEDWVRAKERMVAEILHLGFPRELGDEVAKNLGSPKAMGRMTSYLREVKPRKAELVVDEMLAICADIQAWREKKESERANASINEILNDDSFWD